ncbi:MAG: PspA/IM30 family protein [Candidatus Poribacteria bacterium]|nr:PspA/IM30 family protein [Candidatus Poribacteria bacterium]
MKSIKIAGREFTLGSRLDRLFAFFIDGMFLASILLILFLLSDAVGYGLFQIGLFSALLWIFGPKTKLPTKALVAAQVFLVFLIGSWADNDFHTLTWSGIALWTAGLLFMDGFKNGQGIGKKLLSLQVLRLKDGKPGTLKDSFIRRLTSVFQPLDSFWTFGKRRQRIGDKLAETVVVKYDPESEQIEVETKDPEMVLENAIAEMTNRLSEAREKVDASIGVEKQFQNAYEGALAQAERCEERATIAIQAGREDLAREDLAQRNEYRQLANRYKTQWDEQKQVVAELTTLLETLQQKTEEAERKRDIVIAQHRNVDAQKHLQQTLTEVQDGAAFEILNEMEQNASEAATLAKAASDVDIDLRDTKLNREFADYAEEASIENDLAELKAKLQ